jgi:hypothetical protein
MLLQMKKERREASSRSLMRYAEPAATVEGSRSIRKRNCELTSSRSSAF